ncbi:MAG: hypothetical protein EXR72_04865 [Myxococcales bacterium]|nr:hypothetical protein [Myxococcales bacterium]
MRCAVTYIAGSLLVRYGLIRHEQLVEAERLRQLDGNTLGECLVRLGVLNEEQLVNFYQRRLMVPRIAAAQLARVSSRAIAALPADMVAEFRVFPVEIDAEGTITLAMADPADTHVVDELTFFTDRFCQRAVATESLIRAAIERYYRVRFDAPPITARVAQPTPVPRADETLRMAGLPRVEPEPVMLLTQIKHADDTPLPAHAPMPPDSPTPLAARPNEAEAEAPPRGPPQPSPDDPKTDPILLTHPKEVAPKRRKITLTGLQVNPPPAPLAALRTAATREAIAAILLEYLAAMAPRAILFVMRRDRLEGFDGRGEKLDPSLVQRLAVSTHEPSLFSDVIRSRLPYRGPLPETPANRAFAQSIDALPGEVLLLPIAVRDRVIALAYADGLSRALPDASLHAVSREAGQAYERLILESKR